MTQWIREVYLEEKTKQQLHQHFQQNEDLQSVTMTQFFTEKGLEQIIQEVIDSEFVPDMNEIMHRRKVSSVPQSLEIVLDSVEFHKIFESITGNQLSIPNAMYLQKYGHKDYKIIHDETVLDPGYDIIIDLTPEWDDNLGGYVAYTDGEGQFYTIGSSFGSISIVKRTENFHFFVKYVNHYAENLNRYLVILNS